MGYLKGLFKRYKDFGWSDADIKEAKRVFLSHRYIRIDNDSKNIYELKCIRCGFTISTPKNIKKSSIYAKNWKEIIGEYKEVTNCSNYIIKEIIE